jgi:Tfp pilus assembly protein PilF
MDAAIAELDDVVRQEPNYASAYINRAMLLRLKLESQLSASQHIFDHSIASVQPLFTNLSRAIHVSLPSSSPTDPVSPFQAKSLRTAYSHRAYLYLKAAETGTALQGLEKSELEELASKDFAGAARYGDELAREMSVRTNPYAKMCGAIVRNALNEERKGAGL